MPIQQVEEEIQQIARMDRTSLIKRLRSMECDFALDFTDEFLRGVSLGRLRHIVTAAALRTHNASREKSA